ncbi:MAG: PG0870-related protein, partial [Bacteroidia bacterium]|nr:PG0870-related protein [Bacteroidia bacterium]
MKYLPGRTNKHLCPACKEKTFVPYVDQNDNWAGPHYGRCERVNSCGYHLKPPSGEVSISLPPTPKPTGPYDYIYETSLEKTVKRSREKNGLFRFLSDKFGREKTEFAFNLYKVGTWNDGETV